MTFEYRCDKCGVIKTVLNSFLCPCGGEFKLFSGLAKSLDPFKPYVLENGVPDPVLIDSRDTRDRIFKERGIDQLPYKTWKYHPYSRIFPVCGKASRGSGTRWNGETGVSY